MSGKFWGGVSRLASRQVGRIIGVTANSAIAVAYDTSISAPYRSTSVTIQERIQTSLV